MMKISRQEAIRLICTQEVSNLSDVARLSEALNWHIHIPIDSNEFDEALITELSEKYRGVVNGYLSTQVSALIHSDVQVIGENDPMFACPCCGYKTLPEVGEFYICPVCYWEDTGVINPGTYSSANQSTLGEARRIFDEIGISERRLLASSKPDERNKYERVAPPTSSGQGDWSKFR